MQACLPIINMYYLLSFALLRTRSWTLGESVWLWLLREWLAPSSAACGWTTPRHTSRWHIQFSPWVCGRHGSTFLAGMFWGPSSGICSICNKKVCNFTSSTHYYCIFLQKAGETRAGKKQTTAANYTVDQQQPWNLLKVINTSFPPILSGLHRFLKRAYACLKSHIEPFPTSCRQGSQVCDFVWI